MSKPDGIPEDIWLTAGQELVGRPHLELSDRYWIARALMAERSRNMVYELDTISKDMRCLRESYSNKPMHQRFIFWLIRWLTP